MKTFIISLLIFVCATPAFCAPNWREGANDNVKYYDTSDLQVYAQQLKENFYKKYTVEVSPTEAYSTAPMGAYDSEVEVPIFQYMIDHPRVHANN